MEGAPLSFDVFCARDIAQAAGVDCRDVEALVSSGRIPTIDGRFVDADDAVAAVRSLRRGTNLAGGAPALFHRAAAETREAGVPLAGSVIAHAVIAGGLALLLASGGAVPHAAQDLDTTRLVFLALPGPGGGGGGGGLRQLSPPPAAEMKGANRMRSPVPTARVVQGRKTERPAELPVPEPAPRPAEPPPQASEPAPAPPVVAPIATVAADARDRAGLPADAAGADSRGSGSGGGAGAGAGTGLGNGGGAGVWDGSGGGTGGGPYRPGSGITPPALVHEVKPDYSEEARRRGLSGDVELEIVVRSDGSVGDVRLLRGLGAGLDQRAIDAVRRWRFSPARRLGTPVDVLVEVAVEFRLR